MNLLTALDHPPFSAIRSIKLAAFKCLKTILSLKAIFLIGNFSTVGNFRHFYVKKYNANWTLSSFVEKVIQFIIVTFFAFHIGKILNVRLKSETLLDLKLLNGYSIS